MKKLISMVAVLAMMVTMAFSISSVTAYAEDDIDLIPEAKASDASQSEGRAGSFKFENGNLVMTATGAKGYGVQFTLDQTVDPMVYKFINMSAESTGQFNVAYNVTIKDGKTGWPQLTQDWFNTFGMANAPGEGKGIPAGTYDKVSLGFDGYFTYSNNLNMPADGKTTVKTVNIAMMEPGTLTIKGMKLSTTQDGTGTTTAGGETTATTAGGATTKAATTTASNAKTGWEDNIALYAVVALGAAAVVTVTVVAGKKAKSK